MGYNYEDMTFERLLELMDEYSESGDTEVAHAEADAVLVAVTRRLGGWLDDDRVEELLESYEKVGKWYS